MKALGLLLFQLLATLSYSQANWFPTDARWTYSWAAFGGWGYVSMEVLPGDTLLGNQLYKKVLITDYLIGDYNEIDTAVSELRLFYEKDDRVYVREGGNRLLYDFTAEVGDTLDFMYFGGISPEVFIVDSIGTIDVNGVALRFQDIKFNDLFEPGEFWEMRVMEKIGSVSTHFLYDNTVIQPFDFPSYNIECYRDEEVGYYRPWPFSNADCDEITSESSLDNTKTDMSIYPNPFQDVIRIHFSNTDFDHVIIVDMLGRMYQVNSNFHENYLEVDLHHLNEGVYIISLINEKGLVVKSEKVIKRK